MADAMRVPSEERTLLTHIESSLRLRAATVGAAFPGDIDLIADVGIEDGELRIVTDHGHKYRVEVSRADIPV